MSIRDYPSGPRIYIDMDGVVADFEKQCAKVGLEPKIAKLLNDTYLNLEPMPGAVEAITRLVKLAPNRIFLLTKIPSRNPLAAYHKYLWVYRYLPMVGDHVIITPDKGCVGTRDDVLIDDHPEWANAHNFAGTVIPFGAHHDVTWAELLPILERRLS
jgi:5'(3')-deoxyribonucleotidase